MVEVGSKALAQVLAVAACKDVTTTEGRERAAEVRGEASALKHGLFAAREKERMGH